MQDVMGHGGSHAGMSMIRDMRNRCIVAAVLSVPINLWSPIGREVFGFTVPAPFGRRDDVYPAAALLVIVGAVGHAAPRLPRDTRAARRRAGAMLARGA